MDTATFGAEVVVTPEVTDEILELAMQWRNTGSAPCYRPYRLAYRLRDGNGFEKTFAGKITVNRWLPGSISLFTPEFLKEPGELPPGEIARASEAIALPRELPAGEYELAIGVVDEDATRPVMRLGIRGRAGDGWYPLSRFRVVR